VWIEDNHIHDGAPTGIADESISIDNHSSQPTEYVYILNNHFETGIGGQFIVIPGSVLDTNQARRILIRGNTMENNATAAMQLQYCRDVVVCGNQISNCVTGGIMVFGAATFAGGPNNITICCNVIDQPNETSGNGGDGNGIEVPAGGGGSVTVSNNTITRVRHTGKFGISAGTGKSISVTGNSILNSDGGGINLTANTVATDEGPFICTGNIIRTCTGTTGILATTDIAGCVISNNSITDATNAASRGIFVTNLNSAALTDLVVNGNNIENTGTRSIYIQTQATGSAQAARISVCNNNCRDSGEIGIVIGNYDDSTVSGNVVTSAVSHGIRVDGGTNLNNIFSGNVCMDNGGSGISLAGTNNQVNINNNMSCDNTTDGITIAAATAGTMVCNTVLGNGSAQINGSITGGETANNDIA